VYNAVAGSFKQFTQVNSRDFLLAFRQVGESPF